MPLTDLPDRLLHVWRRRRATDALRAPLRPGAVLFICYGNICRSPFAAALFRRELAKRDRANEARGRAIRSAGFTGSDRPSPSEAIAAAARFKIDLSPHRSAVITADAYRSAALVVTMSPDQARDLRRRFGRLGAIVVLADLDPESIKSRTIRDPFRCPPDVYHESYTRINRCIRALVSALDAS